MDVVFTIVFFFGVPVIWALIQIAMALDLFVNFRNFINKGQ